MPLSQLYNLIVKMRAALFERGVFSSHDLGVPVISVGNITTGGTGKTPLVAFAAKVLAENGRKVYVLTRGYKRENPGERVVVSDGEKILATAKQSGDEPFELAQKLIGVSAVIADRDRVSAGKWALENLGENLGIDAFVLDDGFQHLKLKRSLDLVTVDATDPFGNGWLLPEGSLREMPTALNRAGAIILTRADLAENIDQLKARIRGYAPEVPLFLSHNKTARLISLAELFSENTAAISSDKKAFAFCALGNPSGFFGQLKNEGFDLAETKKFPDHYPYTQKDIPEMEKTARENFAEILLTTVKDAVKLKGLRFTMPCFVVESELVFDDEDGLRKLILQTLS
jgi:tetraacyldisaccharide 4'-kinase